MTTSPIHPKAVGGGLGGLLAGAVITVIQTYWIKGELPGSIVTLIYLAVPGVLSFGAAYLTPSRPIEPVSVTATPLITGPPEAPKK